MAHCNEGPLPRGRGEMLCIRPLCPAYVPNVRWSFQGVFSRDPVVFSCRTGGKRSALYVTIRPAWDVVPAPESCPSSNQGDVP